MHFSSTATSNLFPPPLHPHLISCTLLSIAPYFLPPLSLLPCPPSFQFHNTLSLNPLLPSTPTSASSPNPLPYPLSPSPNPPYYLLLLPSNPLFITPPPSHFLPHSPLTYFFSSFYSTLSLIPFFLLPNPFLIYCFLLLAHPFPYSLLLCTPLPSPLFP
jgi:hypothetical protein